MPIYYGSAPFALKRGSQALNLYYGSTLISGGGGGSTLIGGVAIGTAGDVGTVYEGYTLSDGDDFTVLSVKAAQNPTGNYLTSRSYRTPASAGLRAPAASALSKEYDVDPYHTGWNDYTRGVPYASFADSISIIDGDVGKNLRLRAVRETAGEQVVLNTGVVGQIERTSMIHSAARLVFNTPCVIEWRAKIAPGNAGQHPTLWCLSADPSGGTMTGNEYGFEGSHETLIPYNIEWSSGVSTGTGGSSIPRDSAYHKFTIRAEAATRKYYVDDVLVWTSVADPDNNGNKSDYFLISNHVYDAAFDGRPYSAAAWAGGVPCDMDIDWVRVWRQSSAAHYVPLATISDQLTEGSAAFSFTLPSKTTLWGSESVSDTCNAIAAEIEEPGGSNTTAWNRFPTGLSYDTPTRTISGTMPSGPGALYVAVQVQGDGNTCKPAVFRICNKPTYSGLSTPLAWLQNFAVESLDVYALFNVGRLFNAGTNPKGLAVTGLPAGVSFDSTTGIMSGAPTGFGSGTVSFSCTNAAGQTLSIDRSYTVASATSTDIPIAFGIVNSFDFDNDALITESGGSIDSAAGADGTAITVTNTGTARPTRELRGGRKAARYTAATSQFLQAASASALTDVTVLVVQEPANVGITGIAIDIANGASAATADRLQVRRETTNQWNSRRGTTALNGPISATASVTTGTRRCVIARYMSGASNRLWVDGPATPDLEVTVTTPPTGLTHTTLGARRAAGVTAVFENGWQWRVAVWNRGLTAYEVELLAAWSASVYGTTNNA